MNLIIERGGSVRGIYGEEIALDALGTPFIKRASHVEPDDRGRWLADLSPVGGPVLGPYDRRSEALEAEVAWLEANWLVVSGGTTPVGGHDIEMLTPFWDRRDHATAAMLTPGRRASRSRRPTGIGHEPLVVSLQAVATSPCAITSVGVPLRAPARFRR